MIPEEHRTSLRVELERVKAAGGDLGLGLHWKQALAIVEAAGLKDHPQAFDWLLEEQHRVQYGTAPPEPTETEQRERWVLAYKQLSAEKRVLEARQREHSARRLGVPIQSVPRRLREDAAVMVRRCTQRPRASRAVARRARVRRIAITGGARAPARPRSEDEPPSSRLARLVALLRPLWGRT